MNGSSLGFKDSIFHEVHLHYIASDPDISIQEVKEMAKEAGRVLTQEGAIILSGELRVDKFRETPGLVLAREALAENGFKIDARADALESATQLAPTIRALLELRSEEGEGSFVLIGRKN
ncbi:hypothetical protein HYT84_00175, partial [Candidatus Micrarchaeota archaeon]|nr:hypothetical protein [Candidatus Micrarchaeota archaeon]